MKSSLMVAGDNRHTRQKGNQLKLNKARERSEKKRGCEKQERDHCPRLTIGRVLQLSSEDSTCLHASPVLPI